MKKWKPAFLIALVITLIGMAINFAYYTMGRVMPLVYTMYGGETIIDMGFGLRVVNIYSMLPDGSSSSNLVLDPISFIICLLPIMLVVQLVLTAVRKLKKH